MNITGANLIIDTNIFIASIGKTSPFRWLFDALIKGKINISVTNQIVLEYVEVLEEKTSADVAENIYEFLVSHPFVKQTEIYYNFNLISGDPDDNKFVDCAIASNAFCIVTNDKHFQNLKEIIFPSIRIYSMDAFEKKFKPQLI